MNIPRTFRIFVYMAMVQLLPSENAVHLRR